MADIFLSYKREDKWVAERLSIALEQLGFDVWWDLNLISGQPYRAAIRAVIDQCKTAIVLWSEKSVQSEFVMDEAGYAHRLGKLCPARIDGVELPLGFGQTQTADMIGWEGETTHRGFQNLVSAVEARVGRKGKLGSKPRGTHVEARAAELEAFKTAQFAGTTSALKAFLQQYPRGMFVGFVRGQLETMEVHAERAGNVTHAPAPPSYTPPPYTPPREPVYAPQPSYTPSYTPPRYDVDDDEPPVRKGLPWPLIAVGVIAVAIGVAFWLKPWEQRAQEATTAPVARDVDAEIENARREGRAQAERDLANRQRRASRQADAGATPPTTTTQPSDQSAQDLAGSSQPAPAQPDQTQLSLRPAVTTPTNQPTASHGGSLVWAQVPTDAYLREVWPAAARSAQIEGRATLDCVIQADLTATCTVASVSPSGFDFNDAALRAATQLRAAPTRTNGSSAVGSRIQVVVRFRRDNAAVPVQ